MAEISLRQYLRSVEQHIQNGHYEEAIAHARRVLEHFPRLAAAYRLLGLALVGQARWDEASEVFRRLLSATPDDFVAHQQLSVIYEKLKQPQESLWHLERALDLQPNDQQSVARLRALYTKERGSSLERVPMTTAALAGQYLNNGLNDQAIEVLQQAVSRMPERLDLKLMLARAQWQTGQHLEAGETAVEVLQAMPYTLAANRIMTELWIEVERPADAQRFLSRVEEVDPYLAIRLATGEPAPADTFKLPELDYQQHVRRALTQQSPDWLENLTDENHEEEPLDLSAELGDDWMNEPDPITQGVGRITDNLPDLLPEESSDTGGLSGLSPELMARIDAMRDIAGDSTQVAELPDLSAPKKTRITPTNAVLTGMLDMSFLEEPPVIEEEEELEEDDSWLDELARNDDFTIEASDVSETNDDWIANLERTAGTTGDRVPTGLTGQLGEFDVDDSIEDLDAMLNSLEDAEPIPQGTPRSSIGLTGMLDVLDAQNQNGPSVPVPISDPNPGTKPRRPGSTLDIDTDSLDWVKEFDPDLAGKNTSPLNPDNLPSSDSADSLAWLQSTDIEVDDSAPSRINTGMLDFEGELSTDSLDPIPSPNAWMDSLGVDYAHTDELDPDDPSSDNESDDDAMAWARGLDLVSSAPTSALPSDVPMPSSRPTTVDFRNESSSEEDADALDWMSDESLLAEYEAYETLQGNDEFEDDAYSDTSYNAGSDDVGQQNEIDDEFDLFELTSDDDELTEDELVQNADLYAELEESLGPDDDDGNFIPDEFRANALTNDPSTEGQATMQTPSWQPSDPDDPDQPSMSDDLEWLSADSLSDDLLGEDEYIPDPDADEPITDLDSFFGGPLAETENTPGFISEGDEAELGDDAWLSGLDLDGDASDETPASEAAVEPEFDWSIGSTTDSDVPATDASWLSDLGAAPAEPEEEADFDWDSSGFGNQAVPTEEPDWLSDIEDPAALSGASAVNLDAEGTDDSAVPEDAGWLSDLELEDAADGPAAESDEELIWQPESSFDLTTEDDMADENQLGWLSQASDDVMEDFGALPVGDSDTTEVEPGGENWLADLDGPTQIDWNAEESDAEPATEGWLADLEPSNEVDWDAEESEAEPAGEAWLSELDDPSEEDAVAQPLSTAEAGGWLDTTDDTGLDWETLDDAEPSPTAGMTGLLNNIETQRYGTDLLESLEPSPDDEPTWLETVDDMETVDDAETPPWMMATLETPQEPVESIASGIDWSADTFADDEESLDEDIGLDLPVAEGEAFDWENPAFAAENDPDQLAFGEVDEDEFLYDEEEAFDPDALTTDTPLEGEEAEWLTGIGQTTDESWLEADPAVEEPAWLSDLNAEEEAAVVPTPSEEGDEEFDFSEENALEDDDSLLPVGETGYFTGTADETFDFSDENALEDDDSLLPVGETGYFTGTADETFDFSDENVLEDDELLPVGELGSTDEDDEQNWLAPDDEVEEFDWANETVEDDNQSLEPVVIEGLEVEPVGFHSEAHLSEAESVQDDVTDDDLREYDFDEELEATPAANAPDWLNSMVPGLDLDFEAEEEASDVAEPVAATPASPARRKEFDWLETIVTEETQQRVVPVAPPPPPPNLPAGPSAPSVGDRVRRFIFKDVPSWMRGGTPAATVAPVTAPVAPAATEVVDFDTEFNADMDDDLFDDLDAEFDDFDDSMKK